MLKSYIQVDKQDNLLRPASYLPNEFKGQGNFNQLSDAQLAKYGWYPTNVNPFQGQMAHAGYDENHNIIFNDQVKKSFSIKYLGSMKSTVWQAIAHGIKYDGYVYQYSYHHQMQLQNACIIGSNVTRYKNDIKEIGFLDSHEAKKILRLQVDNMDMLKEEYNFYCNKMKDGFDTPDLYAEIHKSFVSAMTNERY